MVNIKRLLLAVLAVLAVAACTVTSSSNGVHWRGQGERVIQVRVNGQIGFDPIFLQASEVAMREWNVASPWIEFRGAQGECPAATDCIDVTWEPLEYPVIAQAEVGWDSELHMYNRAVVLRFASNFDWHNYPGLLQNAFCHEAGHGLGLDHSPVAGVEGPCQNGAPTPYDVQLVDAAHAHDDVFTGLLTAEEGKPGTKVFEDTPSDLE